MAISFFVRNSAGVSAVMTCWKRCFVRVCSSIFSILVLFLVFSCSPQQEYSYESGRLEFPNSSNKPASTTPVVRFMPWEIWPLGTDLQGQTLHSALIKQGDGNLRAGRRQQALENYYQAQSGSLAPSENEALVIRIASTELALDQPNKSLATLSNYFRTTGRVVEDVDGRFSLLFAHAYGRRGDLDQSVAWFVRVARVSANQAGIRSASEHGLSSLLKSVPDTRLNQISEQWAVETFVRGLAGQERSRRAAGGTIEVGSDSYLWAPSLITPLTNSTGRATTIGVLLPLSGNFSNLGKSVKNGIDLALSARNQGAPAGQEQLKVAYRDAESTPDLAVTHARELVGVDGANVILGPLLSEHAYAVGEFARQNRVPLLALAKNSNFATGESIFRLGATVDSQVSSLVAATRDRLHLKRYAVVYPDDANGRELADAFKAEVAARGLQIVYETSFPRGNVDIFVSIAEALDKSEAEAVFFPDSITSAARFFGALSPRFRAQARPLGAAMWDNPNQLANSSTVLEGAVFVSPFFVNSPRPAIAQFIQSYQGAYGQLPDFLAAQGFDALTILAEAAARQLADGKQFPNAIQQLDTYEGLTGRITVRTDGEMQRQFSVVQLSSGKIQEIPESATAGLVAGGSDGAIITSPTLMQ